MDALFRLAFFAGIGLWIPLALIAALQPSVRRRVMVPLLASAIAAAFEAYISFVWSHTASIPMRVDVFVVLCALTFVDAIAGFSLMVGARGRPDRTPLLAAGMLCLAVPALAIAGFAALRLDFARVDRNSDLARRFRFEAYFRDDETEKRVFGALEPGKNPFAGYYAYAGKDDDRYAHLVINDEGRFWIYHSQLSVWQGTGGPRRTARSKASARARPGPHGHPEPHRTAAPGRRILSARGEPRPPAAAGSGPPR